jgi:hypothetical protein
LKEDYKTDHGKNKTGNKRYTTEIIGENFQLGPKGGEKKYLLKNKIKK